MRKMFLGLAVFALTAAAACGGGDDGDGSGDGATTTAGGPAAATIHATGTTWEPGEVTINAGETVLWDVTGSIVHDLKGDEGVSHKAASKYKYSHTYDKAGTYSYQCTIHPGMNGTVVVRP